VTIPTANERPRPLRIALLIDSFFQPRWVSKIISDIQSSTIAEIVLIIKNKATSEAKPRLKSYWRNRQYLLYALYTRFDELKVKVNQDAFELIDIRPLVSCHVIEVQPAMTKYSDTIAAEDIETIGNHQIDVALAFGFRILKGDILTVPRYGVWSYHHGDNLVNRGGPAGFWEVMEGSPVTGSILQILTEDLDNGSVIYRSWSPTADQFSVKANRNNLYWKSSPFVMRKLRDLAQDFPLCTADKKSYLPYSAPLYKTPKNRELLPRLFRLSAKYALNKIANVVSYDQWSLAYRFTSSFADTNNSFYRFKFLIPPKDRFWADPFPLKSGNRHYVFFEEYLYKTGKAHISVIELNKNGIAGGPTTVLSKDYHLSYPFMFEWEGSHYMLPESSGNRTIELYKCVQFPVEWELAAILMKDVRAKDTTLFEKDGKWWMFVTIAENTVPDELYLYYADSPFGPWTAHRCNPVKSDVRSSRPAGRLFYWNGDLYRPAQDGSVRYGYAISLNRVTQLDCSNFSEVEVSKISPHWRKNLRGTHTLNTADNLTVLDCLMRRFR
jgi:hypothetical protein